MNKKITHLFLNIIYNQKNVDDIISQGLTYAQIAIYLSNFEKEKLISIGEDRIQLTSKGYNLYIELCKKKDNIKKSSIKPDYDSRIDKSNKFMVYLPEKIEKIFI